MDPCIQGHQGVCVRVCVYDHIVCVCVVCVCVGRGCLHPASFFHLTARGQERYYVGPMPTPTAQPKFKPQKAPPPPHTHDACARLQAVQSAPALVSSPGMMGGGGGVSAPGQALRDVESVLQAGGAGESSHMHARVCARAHSNCAHQCFLFSFWDSLQLIARVEVGAHVCARVLSSRACRPLGSRPVGHITDPAHTLECFPHPPVHESRLFFYHVRSLMCRHWYLCAGDLHVLCCACLSACTRT